MYTAVHATATLHMHVGGGGGGGKKLRGRRHPPTLKSSLRASRICYFFFQRGLGKNVIRCQSWGGGGGLEKIHHFSHF